MLKAYGSNGITGLGNENLIVTDTNSISASDLNSLDSKTSGTITTHTSLTTLTGSLATLNAAYASGIDVLGNEDIILTDSTVAAADLNLLNNSTTGNISASSISLLTGSVADLNTAFGAKAASGSNGIDFGGSSGAADQAVEITDATVLAVDLITLNGNTSGTIDASTLSEIEGTAANANTIYDTKSGGDGFTGLGDEAITLTDTTVGAAALIDLYTNGTSGIIDASTVHTITGTTANANTIYSQTSTFTGLGTENITIQGESSNTLAVASLNTLNGNTTGNINADTVTTLTGAISDLNTAYAASASTGDGISNLGNEAITLSDTSVTDVAALNTLNGNTTGLIDADTVSSLSLIHI